MVTLLYQMLWMMANAPLSSPSRSGMHIARAWLAVSFGIPSGTMAPPEPLTSASVKFPIGSVLLITNAQLLAHRAVRIAPASIIWVDSALKIVLRR